MSLVKKGNIQYSGRVEASDTWDSGVSSTKATVWQHNWSPGCTLAGVHDDSSHVKIPSVDSIAHEFTLRRRTFIYFPLAGTKAWQLCLTQYWRLAVQRLHTPLCLWQTTTTTTSDRLSESVLLWTFYNIHMKDKMSSGPFLVIIHWVTLGSDNHAESDHLSAIKRRIRAHHVD